MTVGRPGVLHRPSAFVDATSDLFQAKKIGLLIGENPVSLGRIVTRFELECGGIDG